MKAYDPRFVFKLPVEYACRCQRETQQRYLTESGAAPLLCSVCCRHRHISHHCAIEVPAKWFQSEEVLRAEKVFSHHIINLKTQKEYVLNVILMKINKQKQH